MEQGFSDACVALCLEQPPVARVAQTCRSAAIEMPRPTVRRWCEHGYTVAFSKTVRDLSTYFSPPPSSSSSAASTQAETQTQTQGERAFQEDSARRALESDSHGAAAYHTHSQTAHEEKRAVLASIPVTLDDERTQELRVHAGETAEEAVVAFCRTHVASEVGVCIRQLLPVVLEKLQELDIAA